MKNRAYWCLAAALLSTTALAAQQEQAQPTTYGQYYGVVVSDPAAFVNALRTYRQSATGKTLSSTVALAQNIANGTDEATHTVSVFYPSAEAMGADLARTAASKDWAEFMRAVSSVARVETENAFTASRSRINDESIAGDGVATMLFALEVTDQARYTQALNTIFNSEAAAKFPGNLFSGEVIANGDNPGTHWVSFQAKDVGSLLKGVDAFMRSADFAEYLRNARQFRQVVGRYLSRNILTFSPPEN